MGRIVKVKHITQSSRDVDARIVILGDVYDYSVDVHLLRLRLRLRYMLTIAYFISPMYSYALNALATR